MIFERKYLSIYCFVLKTTGCPTKCGGVHDGEKAEIDAHEEVGDGEVTDEEAGDVKLGRAEQRHEQHAAITEHREQEHDPHAAPQRPPAEQVVTRLERVYKYRQWDNI